MWHRTPSRQPSSVLQKPQTSGVRDVSASPVNHSPYYGDMAPTLRGDNSTAGGQYIPESIASPRSMSSTDDRLTQQQQQQMSGGLPYTNHNGNDYNDHNGHGASSRTSISMNSSNIDRVDSNSSINHIQSTPRTSSTAKRLTSLFSRKRRSTSQVRPNGGEGVDSRSNASPAPAVGAGNATVQNGANGHGGNSRPDASDGDGYSGDMVVGDEEYPYGYDNTHGYYDPNSYYYPGDTAYSNAATAEHGALPRRTASASGNQNNHKGLGNNTSVGSQGRRSGEFANGDSGHNGSSSNGNNGNGRNGGSSIVNGSVGAGPQRRHSAGVTQHGAQLNQIEEDDDEYFEVSPVDQYPETYGNAGRRSVDYIAPNSKEAEALAEAGIPLDHSPAQYSHHPQSPSGAMNGGSGLSASAFSQANPLAKSVLRQQMQKQQWLSQQQLGLQQYAAAHQQQSTQMQIQMAQQPTTPGGTTVRPPLPPPIPQLARGGWAGVGAGGGGGAEWQESASPEPQQQQQRQQLQQRYGQPPQPQHASLEDRVTDFKGGPNVSVNTLGNHPLLRDQAQHGRFEHQNHSHSQSGTPIQDQEEHPQPPRLPPKEPLSRGSSAQDAPNALNHNSNLANNNTPDANSTMSPTAAVTPSNRMKSPGQLPQFPQQQHAQQRQYQSSQPPGIQGKAGSPYTPYSLYTQSSTPDIPHRDTRRSTDYSAELDPMAMWQQEQKGQQGGHYPQQGQYQHGQQQRDFHQPYSPDQHDQNSVPPVEQQQHEHQHYQDNSQAKAVDQRIQSPRSMFLTNPDGTTVEASALSTPAAHDGGGRYTQWPLTPLAMPLVSEAMVPPLKPRSDWDRSCLDYFLSKYRDRLEAKNWEKEPFREILGVPAYPSDAALASSARLCSPLSDAGDHDDLGNGMDDILPHLLHDRLFYLAYAITGSSKSTYSHQLWELFGASNPGHLLTVYAALAATNGTPASSASSEPVDLDEFLVAAVEGVKRGDSGATRLSTADKPEDVSMESLLNMVTRRLDEPGTSPYDFVLRQVKSQLRLMKGEMATRFGADSGWRTRIPLKFDRSSSKASSSAQCLPLYHGLQLYLASKQHLIRTAMQRTCAQLPDLSALLGSTITPTNQDTSTTDSPQIPAKIADTGEQNAVVASGRPRTVTLLLDVPGSGKTRLMRDKILEAHGNSGGGGGMYFMAPNLPPPFSSSPSSPSASLAIRTTSPKLLEVARSRNISRDTYSLYQDLSYLERSGIGGGARPVLGIAGIPHNRIVKSETCLDPLFRARKHLLDMLDLEVRGTKWAQLQMASPSGSGREQNGSDLFDLAYRFMRLQHDEKPPALPARPGAAAATARESTNAETDTQPHLIVIDEAQAVIGDPLAERILRGMIDSCRAGGQTYVVGTRPLAHVVHQPQMGFLRKASLPDHSNGSDAASTSQQHQQLDREDLIIRRMPCSKVHVDNAETFWSVLVHHAWSLVGEIYELRAQGFLKAGITGTKVNENGNEIDRSNIQSEHQVTDKHGTNYKIGSIQNSGDDNYDPSSSVPAHHLRNGHHHNNDSVRPRPRQLREIPLLTREGQILSFDINLPVVNGGSSGNAGSNSNSAAANWADLEASLQTWNVLNSTARDETIDREGTRFFGRVRWTATFAEELLRASSMVGKRNGYNSVVGNHNTTTATTGGGRLSPEGVRAAAQRAAGRIKAGLRQRLDDVRGTRCADELIWAALEADVFGASRWFEGPLAADLVAAGFALVEEEDSSQVNNAGSAAGNGNSSLAADAVYGEKSGDVGAGQLERSASRAARISHDRSRPDGPIRARLAEPLVVEAVVEYLYESPVEVLDKYLRRFFTPMQTDSADRECLWKIAEDVLAKKLHNTIRLTSDTVSQHRRTGFFDVLRHSRSPTPIHKLRRHSSSMQQNSLQVQKPLSHHDYWTYGEAERFVGSLDRYYLKDSGVNIDRRGEWLVEDWLYEEEEEHRPNFFFADGGEGYGNDMDDGGALGCLFFLQDRDNSRRKILCVLQFAPAPAPEMTTSTPEPNTTANGETGATQPQHPAASPFPALTNLITNLWSNHPVHPTTGHVQTPWPVFYIYIPPPSTEIDDDAFVAELSQGAARGKMPRNHYVGYVDISNSDGIWGTTFPAWIGQMAEEKRRAVQRQRVEQQQKMAMRRRG